MKTAALPIEWIEPTAHRPNRTGIVSAVRSLFHHLLADIAMPAGNVKLNRIGAFPESGPFIIAANHASHLDTVAILAGMNTKTRRRLRIAASKGYFFESSNPFHRLAVLLFNLIPATGTELMHSLNRLKESEECMLIYPEGTRSRTGSINRFCYGIGKMHRESGIPIVPVAIRGTGKLMPVGRRWAKSGAIDLIIGEPMSLTAADAGTITELIEQRVRELHTTK